MPSETDLVCDCPLVLVECASVGTNSWEIDRAICNVRRQTHINRPNLLKGKEMVEGPLQMETGKSCSVSPPGRPKVLSQPIQESGQLSAILAVNLFGITAVCCRHGRHTFN